MIQILFAFLAGILTIGAPCILLPLPILLGGSIGQSGKTRPIFITLGFVGAFSGLALFLNFLILNLGLQPDALRLIAVLALAVFALFMIWPSPFERLMSRAGRLINKAGQIGQKAGQGNFGGFILGIIIGVVWAPCAGPILGSILALVAIEKNLAKASLLLIAYSLGAGIPMLLIAYGSQALTTKIKMVAKYSHRIQQVFGIILLLLAAAIYFQYDTLISAKLAANFPGFGNGIENKLAGQEQNPNLDAVPSQNLIPEKIGFKDYGPAPEFTGINNWINSDSLTLKQLKGKVVLVDFWTYSCINCIRTLPYVTKWYDTYKDKGLVVVGVHTPEFAFEKITGNVQTATEHFHINYPVAQDNDYATWNNYKNIYWPAEYLINKDGELVYTHFGEGEYDHTENAIRELLGMNAGAKPDNGQDLSGVQSPEMYFGTERLEYLSQEQTPSTSGNFFTPTGKPALNNFELQGYWQFFPDHATLINNPKGESGGQIVLHFHSSKVYMVARSDNPTTITTIVDGKNVKTTEISKSQLYTVFESDTSIERTLIIDAAGPGLEVFTFTFG